MSIPPAPFQWPRWNSRNRGSRTVHRQCPAEWGCPCHPLRCHPKSASLTASRSPVSIASSSRSILQGAADEWKLECSTRTSAEAARFWFCGLDHLRRLEALKAGSVLFKSGATFFAASAHACHLTWPGVAWSTCLFRRVLPVLQELSFRSGRVRAAEPRGSQPNEVCRRGGRAVG